jgi:hypothetical protein
MYLTESSDITAFLDEVGEHTVLSAYERLEDQYGETLEPALHLDLSEESPQYELTVEHAIERKGQRSGKGTQILSRLTGRKHSWPQVFTGELDYTTYEVEQTVSAITTDQADN